MTDFFVELVAEEKDDEREEDAEAKGGGEVVACVGSGDDAEDALSLRYEDLGRWHMAHEPKRDMFV